MSKIIEFKPKISSSSGLSTEQINEETNVKFEEVYKLKNITATVPTYAPKNELDCYVRFVSGGTYKLYVYLGKTVGWKSTILS